MLDKIKGENIKIRTGDLVTKIERDRITVNHTEVVEFDYLIGADGSNSIVRKYLGLSTDKIDLAIQYLLPNSNLTNFEIIFDSKYFGPWYAYIST